MKSNSHDGEKLVGKIGARDEEEERLRDQTSNQISVAANNDNIEPQNEEEEEEGESGSIASLSASVEKCSRKGQDEAKMCSHYGCLLETGRHGNFCFMYLSDGGCLKTSSGPYADDIAGE